MAGEIRKGKRRVVAELVKDSVNGANKVVRLKTH